MQVLVTDIPAITEHTNKCIKEVKEKREASRKSFVAGPSALSARSALAKELEGKSTVKEGSLPVAASKQAEEPSNK